MLVQNYCDCLKLIEDIIFKIIGLVSYIMKLVTELNLGDRINDILSLKMGKFDILVNIFLEVTPESISVEPNLPWSSSSPDERLDFVNSRTVF